jgi:uncharacterized membrane protein
MYRGKNRGTCKIRNETRNEIHQNETKRNQTKPNEIHRNETKLTETKRNGIIQNEIKPILTHRFLGKDKTKVK